MVDGTVLRQSRDNHVQKCNPCMIRSNNKTKVYYLWLNDIKVLHLFYAVQVICDNNSCYTGS